jgi:uncharacterized membrane protein
MKQLDLEGLNRDESFKEIKDVCRSRAKRNLYAILLVLLIAIVFLIYLGQRLYETKDIICFILWAVIACIAALSVLYNYRFKKKIDNQSTPGQLLALFKKNMRIEMICVCVVWLLIIADSFFGNGFFSAIGALTTFILVLFMTYKAYGPWNRRDREITEQLQELIDEK